MSRCRREACTETVEEAVSVHQGEGTEGENEQSQGQELSLEEFHHLKSGQQTRILLRSQVYWGNWENCIGFKSTEVTPTPGILQARTLEWVAISFSKVTGIIPPKYLVNE